jgi:hypothetical protein
LLAATGLALPHPVSGETLTLEAGLDAAFSRIVDTFQSEGSFDQ